MNSKETADFNIYSRVHAFLSDIHAGDVTEAEMVDFEQLLRESEEAQSLYAELIELSVYLPRALAGLEGVTKGQWTTEGDEETETEDLLRPTSPVALLLDTPSPMAVAPSFIGSWMFSNLFSLLVVGLGLCGAWMYQIDIPHPLVRTSQKTISHKTMETGDLKFVGQVTGVADVKWSDQQTATVMGANVPLGRKYALASGLLEIAYKTGAKVILQGPATYVVESDVGGYLSVGKLTARLEKREEGSKKVVSGQWSVASESDPKSQNPKIPKSPIPNSSSSPASRPQAPAPAFAVRTPTATVTDLGTEFGVEVHINGITEAHVFVGRVSMISTRQGSRPGAEKILAAGDAASTSDTSNRIAHMFWNEKRFIRTMPSQPAPASRKADYAATVLSMNPVVYYRMERPQEEKDRFTLFDFASGGHHGKVHLVNEYAQPWMWGRFGDSLFLHGPVDSEYAIVPDYPKARGDQLSASAWVLAEGLYPSAKIAGNWGSGKHGQFHFGMYKEDASLYVAVAQRDNMEIFVHEGPVKPFPLNEWQHTAFVLDKSTLRLYRNGVEVARGHCDGLLQKVELSSLTVGCQASDDAKIMFNFWRGRIDELAIFNRALGIEEIQRLCKPTTK